MSVFPNVQDITIRIQDSPLTAVGGDQNNYYHIGDSTTIASPQHIIGNQNIYQVAPLKGTSLL